LADEEKSNEKKPKDTTTPKEQDETVEEQNTEGSTEETEDEETTEAQEEGTVEKVSEEPDEEKEVKQKPEAKEQTEKKKEKTEKPKKKHGDDFKYIIRLSNTDIDGEKSVVYGLTTIKGVGLRMAALVTDETGIDRHKKVGDLKDPEIEKLQNAIDTLTKSAPKWMLNHRKDYETGEDIHLIGADIDMRLRDEINIMKKIRSYRGIRHERGLPARGQRTRANNRRGLALGVSKKREGQ